MSPETPTPRIREDLHALPAVEEGIEYWDVRDPRSGGAMRLYDVEWQIAARMDGQHSFGELATWATTELGVATSAQDLSLYAERLRELGFFDGVSVEARPSLEQPVATHAPSAELPAVVTPTPVAVPASTPSAPTAPLPIAASASPTVDSGDDIFGSKPEEVAPASSGPTTEVVLDDDEDVGSLAARATAGVQTPLPPPVPPPPGPFSGPIAASTGESGRVVLADLSPEPAPLPRAPEAAPAPLPPRRDGAPSPFEAAAVPPPAKRSRAMTTVLVILLLLAAAAYAGYTYLLPLLKPVDVQGQTVGAASTVTRYYDSDAQVSRSEPTVVSFTEPGKVIEVVAAGVDAQPGTVLAKLDQYDAVAAEIASTKDRLKYYTDKLNSAKAKDNAEEVKADQDKVNEKNKKIAELEERAKKLQLVAPAGGTVAEVLIKSGDAVEAGAPALKMVDKRKLVEFKLAPADAQSFKVDQSVEVQAAPNGPTGTGKVVSVGPAEAKVEITDDANGGIKPGDQVRLVRNKLQGVLKVPAAALRGTSVWVAGSDGLAHAKTVTIVEKSGNEVLVSGGVAAGDKVLTQFPEELHENQKVHVAGE